MRDILIDANIYLEFYQSKKLEPLFDLLEAYVDNILVTKQIVHEVERNKLRIATRFLEQFYQKQFKLGVPDQFVSLPEEIRQRVKEFNIRSETLTRELQEFYQNSLTLISQSKDAVSLRLNNIFKYSIAASPEQINLGKARKEVGNPPGKPLDPLGDQVTWEQFLSGLRNCQRVWIVTTDNDYLEDGLDKSDLRLNPFLYDELLRQTSVETDVRCFRSMSEALKDIRDKKPPPDPMGDLLTDLALDDMAEEEEDLQEFFSGTHPGYVLASGVPVISGFYNPSGVAHVPGISWLKYRCPQCGTPYGPDSLRLETAADGSSTLSGRCKICQSPL